MNQEYIPHQEQTVAPPEKMVITHWRDHLEYFLPKGYLYGMYVSLLLTLLCSALFPLLRVLGVWNHEIWLLLVHALISVGLAFWVHERVDLLSACCALGYHVVFFIVGILFLDLIFFYPIIPAILTLALVIAIRRQWGYYHRLPKPVTPLTMMRRNALDVRRWIRRGGLLFMTVVMIVLSVLPAYLPELPPENAPFTEGKYNGRTYENEFVGLTVTPPPLWFVYRDAELDQMAEYYFGKGYDASTYHLLMYADNYDGTNPENYSSITIEVIRQPSVMTAEEFLKSVAIDYQRRYSSQFKNILSDDPEPMKLGQYTYSMMKTRFIAEAENPQHFSFEEYVFVRMVGRMAIIIYISPMEGDTLESLLTCFKTYP